MSAAFHEVRSWDIPDSPTRVAPPDYSDAEPDFLELSRSRQLDIIERVSRVDPFYRQVMEDFWLDLPPEKLRKLMGLAADSCVTDSGLGDEFREMLIEYFAQVAAVRGDELTEFMP